MISLETHPSGVVLPARVERAEVRQQKAEELRRRVTLLHLLASICETFGSECLTDTRQILSFVKVCKSSRSDYFEKYGLKYLVQSTGL